MATANAKAFRECPTVGLGKALLDADQNDAIRASDTNVADFRAETVVVTISNVASIKLTRRS